MQELLRLKLRFISVQLDKVQKKSSGIFDKPFILCRTHYVLIVWLRNAQRPKELFKLHSNESPHFNSGTLGSLEKVSVLA